ncbi:MAG: hypothetical protein ACOYD3_08525 [Kiritimatiellia bacterium]
MKPEKVIKLPSNTPLNKLPFGKKNPVDWNTGKHLVRLDEKPVAGNVADGRIVFPVTLVQVGGMEGDKNTPATWVYDVYAFDDGKLLMSRVNPVKKPHQWRRPETGAMVAATYGYAWFLTKEKDISLFSVADKDNTPRQATIIQDKEILALGWINEILKDEDDSSGNDESDDPPLPPCGHPGNLPGGGDGGEDDGYVDHPGDQPGGGSAGGVDVGDPIEHPGDNPSPPSSGDCP